MALSFYRREGFRVIGEENGHDGMLFLMERPLEDARHG